MTTTNRWRSSSVDDRSARGDSPASRWELLFAGGVTFLMTGAVVVLFAQPSPAFNINSVANDNAPLRAGFALAYGFSAVLLLRHPRVFGDLVVRDPLLLVLLGWVVGSVAWSVNPSLTFQRSAAVVLTCLFGIYLASAFPPKVVLRLLICVLGLTMVLSMVTIVVLPAWGTSELGWRGVFLFKNNLGRMASLTALLAWVLLKDVTTSSRARSWLRLLFALSVVLLLGSEARSALVVLLLVLGAAYLLPRPGGKAPSRPSIRVPISLFVGALGVVTVMGGLKLADLFQVLGKDEDLTGRTELWQYAWTAIGQHWLSGYGYAGFWGGPDAPSAVIWEHVAWLPTHAHNGALDVLLDLGAIGLGLLGASLTITAIWCLRGIRAGDGAVPTFGLLLVVFLVASASTESVFLKSNTIFTCLPVYIAAAVRPGLKRAPTDTARGSDVVDAP